MTDRDPGDRAGGDGDERPAGAAVEHRRDDLVAIGVGAVGAVVVALLLSPFRADVGGANVALALVLVVIAAAAAGGRRAGAVTAVVAALSFNFLHTRPYLSLRIDGPQDLLTFVLIVVVGVAAGELAHLAASRGRLARERREGIDGLHDLAQMVLVRSSTEALVDRASTYLVRELHLASCSFHWGDSPSPPDLDHRGVVDAPMRHAPGGFELPRGGLSLPVADRSGRIVGRFVLVPCPRQPVSLVDRKLAVLVADVIGPALVRIP
jgi:hypothetical protein